MSVRGAPSFVTRGIAAPAPLQNLCCAKSLVVRGASHESIVDPVFPLLPHAEFCCGTRRRSLSAASNRNVVLLCLALQAAID